MKSIDKMSVINSWEKQKNEPIKVYAIFEIYRELKDRSPKAALAVINERLDFITSAATLRKYVDKYNFHSRADDYIRHMARLRMKEVESQIQNSADSMIKRHSDQVRAQLSSVGDIAEKLKKELEKRGEKLDDLTNKEIVDLICKTASATPRLIQIERLISGIDSDDGQSIKKSEVQSLINELSIVFRRYIQSSKTELAMSEFLAAVRKHVAFE